MISRYSQITVFVLNAISDVFTNVTYYAVIICIKSSLVLNRSTDLWHQESRLMKF